ncbi:GNAT family N-acetyltransferase [Allosphingosinicella deserti]|uniref:GNAT family N-acetyltransferase n=1 Tax=Allosphingosinicella deserti TaxID=2116704 RepID=A0A2P7QKT9_9SPHN|nr:GNAT family N-acetyltransferase [Sphingomonas deserti]PSJ38568.1 GNAT family N-acetyltransferase [Sphingomonas deserti]
MFARTERLLLRPGWTQDAPALYAAVADEAIVRNLASAPWPYTLADAEAFLTTDRSPAEPSMLIFRRTLGAPQLAGAIGLGRRPDGEMELGYWIARPFWGLGYATEAGRAVIAMARESLRLPRLHAGHFLDNPASGRVLHKLGFRSTGVMPRFSAGRRELAPCREFALVLDAEEPAAADARMAA